MKSLSTELKVGIFALIVLVILTVMTFRVGDIELFRPPGYTVYVLVNNLAGVDKKSKVRIAGVDAGTIEAVSLEGNRVKVEIRMYKGVKLHSDSTASVSASGLLGDKYLEINPGSRQPFLKDGDTIMTMAEQVDMNSLMQSFARASTEISHLTANLNAVVGTEEAQRTLQETIHALRDLSKNLNAAVTSNDRRLTVALERVTSAAEEIGQLVRENRDPLSAAIADARVLAAALREQGPSLLAALNQAAVEIKEVMQETRVPLRTTIEQIQAITGQIESGQGTLGLLLTDERLYHSMDRAAEGMWRFSDFVGRSSVAGTLPLTTLGGKQ